MDRSWIWSRCMYTCKLIYLGISSLFSSNSKIEQARDENSHKIKWYTAVKIGLLTNLMNPKASLFFLSLFTLVVGPKINPMVMAVLALILVSTTVLWFSMVVIFLTHQKMRYFFEDNQKLINRLFGMILISNIGFENLGTFWIKIKLILFYKMVPGGRNRTTDTRIFNRGGSRFLFDNRYLA